MVLPTSGAKYSVHAETRGLFGETRTAILDEFCFQPGRNHWTGGATAPPPPTPPCSPMSSSRTDFSHDDNSTEDPDYIANESDYNINYYSNYSDESTDLEDELADLITDQDYNTEMTFLQDLLQSLQVLKRGQITGQKWMWMTW